MSEKPLPPCEACARCCYLHVPVTPDDADRMPKGLYHFVYWPLAGYRAEMKRVAGHCVALDTKTGTCMIYDKRPEACRKFERGGAACLKAAKQLERKARLDDMLNGGSK